MNLLRVTVLAALAASLAAPARAVEMSPAVAQLYESVSIYPPKNNAMTVCYGFVCRRRALLDFTAADKRALGAIMAAGKASPAAERAALRKAVVWFDKRVAPLIGTGVRVARADSQRGGDATNFDCWDTTRNVTALMVILQDWNMLRHHTVGDPRYRGNFLVLQNAHNTAVVKERVSKREWAVDMWTAAFAQPPDVMPVEQWMTEK
jgi:hypothetical protein